MYIYIYCARVIRQRLYITHNPISINHQLQVLNCLGPRGLQPPSAGQRLLHPKPMASPTSNVFAKLNAMAQVQQLFTWVCPEIE